MKLRKGNMLDYVGYAHNVFITTNPVITKDRRVVMGAGIARQIRDRYPGIDASFAKRLQPSPDRNIGYIDRLPDGGDLWWFMVKQHWSQPARLDIIAESTRLLSRMAHTWSDETFFLNFPGIGNGGLRREEVLPIVETLPDNVCIWEYT